ncbi:MAG: hypothetical protein OEM51_01635 [Gammaproteobacteria bacterium]|nr:hypothetical protein [Gammaproteobacteria bacterium]
MGGRRPRRESAYRQILINEVDDVIGLFHPYAQLPAIVIAFSNARVGSADFWWLLINQGMGQEFGL